MASQQRAREAANSPEFLRLALRKPGNPCRSQPSLSGCCRPATQPNSQVGRPKRWKYRTKADILGHLSVKSGRIVLSCLVHVRFCPRNVLALSPLKCRRKGSSGLGAQVFSVSFCAFCLEFRYAGQFPGSPLSDTRDMVAGRRRSWKGARVRVFQNNHKLIAPEHRRLPVPAHQAGTPRTGYR